MFKKKAIKNLTKDLATCVLSFSVMALVSAAACSYGQAQAEQQALAKQQAQALAEAEAEPLVCFGEIKSEQLFASANVKDESEESETLAQIKPLTAEKADELINCAKGYLGVPYVYGSRDPSVGFDCSGFVGYVFRNCGYILNGPCAQAQLDEDCEIIDRKYLNPGDLIFCGRSTDSITHVGIYIGNHQMIHAGTNGIVIVNIDEPYWVDSICCYGRPLCYELSENTIDTEVGK